ncbi:MAG: hypothetical protein GWN62_09470 [Aliifodinibius sp.]|nr:hypothetical protein [Fodinibius sp.]
MWWMDCGELNGFDLVEPMYHDRDDGPDTCTLSVKKVKRETEKAWLLECENAGTYWFPKSQCRISDEMDLIEYPGWLNLKDVG